MMRWAWLLAAGSVVVVAVAAGQGSLFRPRGVGERTVVVVAVAAGQVPLLNPRGVGEPIAVLCDGRPFEIAYRSLFPFVGDLDGDGRDDLLLGTPDAGRLKVFPIRGSNRSRSLGAPSWFDEKVPDGRIPKG